MVLGRCQRSNDVVEPRHDVVRGLDALRVRQVVGADRTQQHAGAGKPQRPQDVVRDVERATVVRRESVVEALACRVPTRGRGLREQPDRGVR